MNKRSRVWAILAAGILTLGVAGLALAIELKEPHQGITVSWDSEGNPVIDDGDANFTDSTDCPWVPGEGEVIFHFVQSGDDTDVNGTDVNDNLIDVDFEDEADANDVPADTIQNDKNVDWFVGVTASDGEVTLVTANSNVEGGDLRVSHICIGDAPDEEESAPPSFEQSQVGETDAPSDVPSDTPSDVPSEAPSFEQSQAGETDIPSNPPSFEQSQLGETDAPTEPNTAAVGGNGTSAPASGAWLLVVALGVLLASIVVLSPARAKSPR